MPNHRLIFRQRNVRKLHLLRRLLLPLLDDLLNAADKEPIYIVSPTVWKQSNQRSSQERKSHWKHKPEVLV